MFLLITYIEIQYVGEGDLPGVREGDLLGVGEGAFQV